MALARVGLGVADGEHRPAAEAAAAFAASASASAPWPSLRARADDPRADRADDGVVALARFAQASAAATVTHCASPSKQGATATATSSSPRSFSARTRVRERDRQRAAGDLDVGDAQRPRAPAQTGATWLCSVQQTTGMPAERLRELARPPRPCGSATWPGVYGSAITCAPSSGASPSPRVRFA